LDRSIRTSYRSLRQHSVRWDLWRAAGGHMARTHRCRSSHLPIAPAATTYHIPTPYTLLRPHPPHTSCLPAPHFLTYLPPTYPPHYTTARATPLHTTALHYLPHTRAAHTAAAAPAAHRTPACPLPPPRTPTTHTPRRRTCWHPCQQLLPLTLPTPPPPPLAVSAAISSSTFSRAAGGRTGTVTF